MGPENSHTPSELLEILSKHLSQTYSMSWAPVLPSNIPPASSVLQTTLPTAPLPLVEAIQNILQKVTPYLNASSLSPNYYGFVTGGATPAALAADFLVSIYDQNAAVHLPEESIATDVEVCALNMLLDLFRFDRQTWGVGKVVVEDGGTAVAGGGSATFTTGATASNVLGLALGREWVLTKKTVAAPKRGPPAINRHPVKNSVGERGLFDAMRAAYVERIQVLSTLPHSSIAKAASIVGIGRANVIDISAAGSPLEIDMQRLEEEASSDTVASILVISAGEVNTGRFATNSLAQMRQVRDLCDKYGVWIHVDGAFGLFGRALGHDGDSPSPGQAGEFADIVDGCAGFELADSITGDGHKLLNVPYDCGFFFTRHKGLGEQVFQNGNAAYLTPAAKSGKAHPDDDDDDDDVIPSPLNIGIENSRRFRALPVYTTLLAYGRDGYREMLQRQIRLARRLAAFLHNHEGYELLPNIGGAESLDDMLEKTFIVVLFRAKDEQVNAQLVQRINASGKIYVSGTKWGGQAAARIAVSNWRADVQRDGDLVEEVLGQVLKGE